jgi:DNA-directed RNA polymerase subunit RPC12/RpoP|tara:strand:- start:2918 stop:3259 length:342 start_codon:yes stop_codon:yes gene_type:complete
LELNGGFMAKGNRTKRVDNFTGIVRRSQSGTIKRSTKILKHKKDEIKEINICREACGLPPIKTGFIKCLKCDRKFESLDITRNRLCDSCTLLMKYHGSDIDEAKMYLGKGGIE